MAGIAQMGRAYVYVSAEPEPTFALVKAMGSIKGRHLKLDVASVWWMIRSYLKEDDGLLLCSEEELAADIKTTQPRVKIALKKLAEIGALIDLGDGQYRAHPDLLWHGDLDMREEAAAKAPPLSLGAAKKPKLSLVGK